MIDFSEVWGKFANLGDNPVVFSVVLGTLILYVLLLVWARRKDKQDKLKVCDLMFLNDVFRAKSFNFAMHGSSL